MGDCLLLSAPPWAALPRPRSDEKSRRRNEVISVIAAPYPCRARRHRCRCLCVCCVTATSITRCSALPSSPPLKARSRRARHSLASTTMRIWWGFFRIFMVFQTRVKEAPDTDTWGDGAKLWLARAAARPGMEERAFAEGRGPDPATSDNTSAVFCSKLIL
jgi:hypothetical protein